MLSKWMPDYMFNTYRDVTPDFLKRHGIHALLLDIDNTFAPYEQPEPDDDIRAWIQAMQSNGITMAFVSNNNYARVELFNRTLGLPARAKCGKPAKRNVLRMMNELRLAPETTAVLGDQLLTDAYAGKRLGMRALIVPPIHDKTTLFFRAKRLLERPVIRRFRKAVTQASESTCTNFSVWRQ